MTTAALRQADASSSAIVPGSCFHCGLEIPADLDLEVGLGARRVPVCCHGCAAAVQFLEQAGLEAYYQFREGPTGLRARADDTRTRPWADAGISERYLQHDEQGDRAVLALDGLRCAACAWLVETGVGSLPGVRALRVEPASARLDVTWNAAECSLDAVVGRVRQLGFECVPAHDDQEARLHARQRRRSLRSVGIAGIVAMQVMMLAIADYAGLLDTSAGGMDPSYRALLLWAQMVLASVSVLVAADTFVIGAWRALRARHLTMDVPVALAVLLAWGASVAILMIGSLSSGVDGTHLYFDSVAMFVFLLLLGRHLELGVRQHFARSDRSLAALLPELAHRLADTAAEEGTAEDPAEPRDVPAATLVAGMRVRVRPGELFPADGRVLSGTAYVDRSVLTGESAPIRVTSGSEVDAGSRNLDGVLDLTVTRAASESGVAGIPALLRRARANRPRTVRLADRAAGMFLAAVLVTCTLTALAWLWIDPQRVLPVVLATLIVTCPCALSLATPTALTAAAIRLRRSGVVLGAPDALEAVAACTEVCFDKTGTLTRPEATTIEQLDGPDWARDVICALEADVTHPIASAVRAAFGPPRRKAADVRFAAGAGVEGSLDQIRYRFGSSSFAAPQAHHEETAMLLSAQDVDGWRIVARFTHAECLVPAAASAIRDLRAQGLTVAVLSGDAQRRVDAIADRLEIAERCAAADPAAKLAWLEARQSSGATRVLYVGDGINDAPALGGASVSVAVGSASEYARSAADIVLLEPGLEALADLVRVARRTRGRIRLNLGWAVAYNLIALPLAMGGLITPWLAAIGMSASSLLVTASSAALTKSEDHH